jgi:hypothetical protein
MIKAVARGKDGKHILLIGLSYENLDRLREDGLKGFIPIKDLGLPIDIIITAGPTEDDIANGLRKFIGPDTVIEDKR